MLYTQPKPLTALQNRNRILDIKNKTKKCKECGFKKNADLCFYKEAKGADGFRAVCKFCFNKKRKKPKVPTPDEQICKICGYSKPKRHFDTSKRASNGLRENCIKCLLERKQRYSKTATEQRTEKQYGKNYGKSKEDKRKEEEKRRNRRKKRNK